MKNNRIVFICMLLSIGSYIDANRSIHRPEDPKLPKITVFWTDDPQGERRTLSSDYLEEWSLFGRYNKEFFDQNRIPTTVSYRYEPHKNVEADALSVLIEECITKEIFKIYKKPVDKEFKNFIILKDRNFNYKMHAGLIILKFKNYPFVVKLLIDNPNSFTKPYSKGIETSFFFMMGGGMNRYLAGFTRIPNLHVIEAKIAADPKWAGRITMPRKWYWTPHDVRHFTVEGKNIGTQPLQSQSYPSIYGIICDEIAMERQLSSFSSEDIATLKDVTQFLGNNIDPHVYNFFIEKGTQKIAIIDTEHLASMIGLKDEIPFDSNLQWYSTLVNRGAKNMLFKSKKTRKKIQQEPISKNLVIT